MLPINVDIVDIANNADGLNWTNRVGGNSIPACPAAQSGWDEVVCKTIFDALVFETNEDKALPPGHHLQRIQCLVARLTFKTWKNTSR